MVGPEKASKNRKTYERMKAKIHTIVYKVCIAGPSPLTSYTNTYNPPLFSYFSREGTEPAFVTLITSPGVDSQPGGIVSSESIPGLIKRLQMRAL